MTDDPRAVLELIRETLEEGLPREFRMGTGILADIDDCSSSLMFSAPEMAGTHLGLLDEALEPVLADRECPDDVATRGRVLRALLPPARP